MRTPQVKFYLGGIKSAHNKLLESRKVVLIVLLVRLLILLVNVHLFGTGIGLLALLRGGLLLLLILRVLLLRIAVKVAIGVDLAPEKSESS